ncbi:MAG: oligosaccharide flippase family protein [Lachnospiraceae bacterium]|nr:oligosaccharide flippase family protein [Lachnospiraceae bacterium]
MFSRFLGFLYKIFLAQALGAEGMGIYQLIFPVFAVCHALTASGLEVAIARFTAFHKKEEHASFLYAGLFLSLSVSLVIASILWYQADLISIHILHEARCGALLRIIAGVIPLSAVHCCFSGSYLGKKKAAIPAGAQILEQTLRIGAVWLLCRIYTQQGHSITPDLAVWGLLAGEAGSALFMLSLSNSTLPRPRNTHTFLSRCRTLLGMALPLTGTRLSLSLLQSAEAILIPISLRESGLNSAEALSLYGILTGMSLSFLMFPNAVTSSISAMLLPVISEEQAQGNKKNISTAIEYTILFGLIIGILFTGIFLRYGVSLGTIIFHEQLAGEFLATLAWICPFLYFTGNLNSILHGLGNTKITFFNQLAAIVVRIVFIMLFVPTHGIQGVLWGLLASQFLLCLLGIRAISTHFAPTLGLDTFILKPLSALLLSSGGMELFKRFLPTFRLGTELLTLTVNICIMAAAYFLLLFIFGIHKLIHLPGLKNKQHKRPIR